MKSGDEMGSKGMESVGGGEEIREEEKRVEERK